MSMGKLFAGYSKTGDDFYNFMINKELTIMARIPRKIRVGNKKEFSYPIEVVREKHESFFSILSVHKIEDISSVLFDRRLKFPLFCREAMSIIEYIINNRLKVSAYINRDGQFLICFIGDDIDFIINPNYEEIR